MLQLVSKHHYTVAELGGPAGSPIVPCILISQRKLGRVTSPSDTLIGSSSSSSSSLTFPVVIGNDKSTIEVRCHQHRGVCVRVCGHSLDNLNPVTSFTSTDCSLYPVLLHSSLSFSGLITKISRHEKSRLTFPRVSFESPNGH